MTIASCSKGNHQFSLPKQDVTAHVGNTYNTMAVKPSESQQEEFALEILGAQAIESKVSNMQSIKWAKEQLGYIDTLNSKDSDQVLVVSVKGKLNPSIRKGNTSTVRTKGTAVVRVHDGRLLFAIWE
jgi:hypothetical protein